MFNRKEYVSFNSGRELLSLLKGHNGTLKGGLDYTEEFITDTGHTSSEYAVSGRFDLAADFSTGEDLAVFSPSRLDQDTFAEHFEGGVIHQDTVALDALGYVLIRR